MGETGPGGDGGRGYGRVPCGQRRLCQHFLQAASPLCFRLMQFNLVVSTNTAGLRCWQRIGFQVACTLPGALQCRQLGDVDALVMIQSLIEEPVR